MVIKWRELLNGGVLNRRDHCIAFYMNNQADSHNMLGADTINNIINVPVEKSQEIDTITLLANTPIVHGID